MFTINHTEELLVEGVEMACYKPRSSHFIHVDNQNERGKGISPPSSLPSLFENIGKKTKPLQYSIKADI